MKFVKLESHFLEIYEGPKKFSFNLKQLLEPEKNGPLFMFAQSGFEVNIVNFMQGKIRFAKIQYKAVTSNVTSAT